MQDYSSPMTAAEGMRAMQRETPPLRDRLMARKQQLSTEMSKVDNLLKLLDRNEGIEEFVNLMGGISI